MSEGVQEKKEEECNKTSTISVSRAESKGHTSAFEKYKSPISERKRTIRENHSSTKKGLLDVTVSPL